MDTLTLSQQFPQPLQFIKLKSTYLSLGETHGYAILRHNEAQITKKLVKSIKQEINSKLYRPVKLYLINP